jgi:MFS family permease
MQSTTLPYLAYRISGRPLDLGLIGFSNTLPTLLFALPAGVLVEHWDKRKTVIILQGVMSIQAFGLAILTFTGHIQIWHIVALAFFYGTAVAVEVTARQAMLIELSGRESLPSAIALQTTAFNLGRVLGPMIAGVILTLSGNEGTVFLVNGISFIFVMIGLFFARTRFKVESGIKEDQGWGSQFREGLAYIGKNSMVISVIVLAALLGFFGIPLIQQVPVFARDIFKTIADTEAMVASRTSNLYIAQGVGALIAAFLAAYLSSMNKWKMLMLGQVAFIIPVISLGWLSNMNFAMIALVFIGWGTVTQLVSMNTLIQMDVPNDLRGRVFSVYFWALQGVAPFGSIVIGWVAQKWGAPNAAIAGGMICLVGMSLVQILTRKNGTTPGGLNTS